MVRPGRPFSSQPMGHASKGVTFPEGLPEAIRFVLADAQTNGGLLAAVPEKHARKALAALERRGVEAWPIGWLEKGRPGLTIV